MQGASRRWHLIRDVLASATVLERLVRNRIMLSFSFLSSDGLSDTPPSRRNSRVSEAKSPLRCRRPSEEGCRILEAVGPNTICMQLVLLVLS